MKKSALISLSFLFLNFAVLKAQDSKVETNSAFTSFTASQFKDKFKENYQLLDVRNAQEYNLGHIKGATSMEVMDKNSSEKVKNLSKESNVFIYGKTAEESKLAAQMLRAAGFQNIYLLEGSYADLLTAGMQKAK